MSDTLQHLANIFIDPDTVDEMQNNDLFPEHFIKSLEPPGNYVGAEKLFSEAGKFSKVCVREIPSDYINLLPLSHKPGFTLERLPDSLEEAVLEYAIFRALRTLSGEGHKHSSMLVNVSRFNAVQRQVHDEVYRLLQDLKDTVDAWATSVSWDKSQLLNRVHEVWQKEYAEHVDFQWDEVLRVLKRAIAPVEVRLVNMRGGGLDYTKTSETGMHIIAVGGLALARGLTLEGLAISYVLRNVGAADTLLQMGRWFGYRPGYEHLCRVHATSAMLEDFREVSEAVEELRDDLIRMERMGITPNAFGLKVRESRTGIAITAANKMRAAKPLLMAVDLSARHLQAYELFNDEAINTKHFAAVTSMVESLESNGAERRVKDEGAYVWSGVSVLLIQNLLQQFELPQLEFALASADSSLALDYIADRATGELAFWDVAIPFRRLGSSEQSLQFPLNLEESSTRFCRQRHSGTPKSSDSGVVKITAKNVVADAAPNDLQYGERVGLKDRAEALRMEFPDFSAEKRYLLSRERPLLLIHIFDFQLSEKNPGNKKLKFGSEKPVVTLSLAFPDTAVVPLPREYAISKRLAEIMQKQLDEAQTDEELVDEE